MKHTGLFGKALTITALAISLFQFSACEEPLAEAKTHTVVYSGNGGDSGVPPVDQKKYAAGESVVVAGPATLAKSGHVFSGWSETPSATQAAFVAGSVFAMGDKDVTLFAVWTKRAVADPVTTPTEPTGPATDPSTTPSDPGVSNNPDTPAVKTHAVTFESNGGSAIEAQIIVENKTVARPANPVRNHYEFLGWYRDASFVTPWNFASDTVTGNVTLYANWLAYTVTYNGNGNYNGSAPADSGPYAAGESFVAAGSGDLAKRGYAFAGWSESKTATTAAYEAGKTYPISGKNHTLYAVWKQLQSYAFTYQLADNTESTTYYYPGDTVTISSTLRAEKANYAFCGWSGFSNSTTVQYTGGATLTMPANRVTLYPVFEYVPLITYTAGSTGTISGVSSQRIGKNAVGTEVTAVANAGYHFIAWSDGKTTATRQDSNMTKDTTLTAIFEKDLGITYAGPTKESVTISCASTVLHKTGSNTSLSASVPAAYSSCSWYIDGTDARISANSIAFDISNLEIGAHTLAVVVTKNGAPYSSQINFSVIY